MTARLADGGGLTCRQCGGPRKRNPKFCSRKCYSLTRTIPRPCQHCGKQTSRHNLKFCSRTCSGAFRAIHTPRVIRLCQWCGEPRNAKNDKYCSVKCRQVAAIGQKYTPERLLSTRAKRSKRTARHVARRKPSPRLRSILLQDWFREMDEKFRKAS